MFRSFKNTKADLVAIILIIILLLCQSFASAEKLVISEISIATPQWDDQTNKDGTGLFFEIVRNIYEPKGIKIKYTFFPWKRAQMMVSSAQNDAMLCVWNEDASAQKHLIPDYPMFIEYTGVIFKKERIKNWEGIKGLDGKTAVWLRGYDYHTSSYLKDFKFSQWVEVDDYHRAWNLIDAGRYDIYIDALIDLNKYIRINKVDMTPYMLKILWGNKTYMAFSNTEKSKKLINIFDKEIIKLHNSGKLKQIYNKWHVNYPDEAWTLPDQKN